MAYRPLYAETFAAESRRRTSLPPELDWELVSEAQTALADVSGGRIVGTLAPIAIHGERLAVIRVREEAIDGSVLESLVTLLFATDLRLEWAVSFEPEDLDAAVE